MRKSEHYPSTDPDPEHPSFLILLPNLEGLVNGVPTSNELSLLWKELEPDPHLSGQADPEHPTLPRLLPNIEVLVKCAQNGILVPFKNAAGSSLKNISNDVLRKAGQIG